ncbi:MAG TPA: MgtC/SapB family protein [Mycobacteriales bacterium]
MSSTTLALAAAHGQGLRQVLELLLAFGLSSLIGLERQLRGKAAGLRTQAIVGTASALIILVSKYGFGDVLAPGEVVLDPSRVAAQIVTGIGFLGAGLILTRRGTVVGLTTAASVWETAAIGMAAGAGLPLLALLVTALHFVVVYGYTVLTHHLPGARSALRLRIDYEDGRGLLRTILATCTRRGWSVQNLAADDSGGAPHVTVALGLHGRGDAGEVVAALSEIDGVLSIDMADDEGE